MNFLKQNPFLTKVIPIAAIFSFRMFGIFMLIPVFTVYAAHLKGATPILLGIALGSYGLSQFALQIPFGILSDRFGRKLLITIGLLLFAAGSLLGALSNSIYTMILARTLQGTGAIGSVLIALLADLTTDKQRTLAMAVIGMTIGISFGLAMIISPIITTNYGLKGTFYLTTFLALFGIFLLHIIVPSPNKNIFDKMNSTKFTKQLEIQPSATNYKNNINKYLSPTKFAVLKSTLHDKELQKLNIGIFIQHFILTANFYIIPLLLQQYIQQEHLTQMWHFYLLLMSVSFIGMLPFITLAERKKKMRIVFILSVFITCLTQFCLIWANQQWISFCFLIFLYFIAFNILEASLPSLTTKLAHPNKKGTAMGIYSSSQFLGIFVGGTTSGLLYQFAGNKAIFLISGILSLLWLYISLQTSYDKTHP